MDLNQLTPSQIVLLTLLVSFVTSIATGIVTVSLMEQAPGAITQTVNRVVERTVEKVVPSGQEASVAAVEKTVIVKESDLIAAAVEKTAPSIVRLFTTTKDAQGGETEVFLGFGIVADKDGLIVTDAAILPESGVVSVKQSDGTMAGAALVSREEGGVALLQDSATTTEDARTWTPAKFASGKPSLGAVVIGISGRSSTRIGDGIITTLPDNAGTTTAPAILETNVPSGAIAFGSALVNVNGEIEGISTLTSRAAAENAFIAAETIMRAISTGQSSEDQD
jgi:hypothetical protein